MLTFLMTSHSPPGELPAVSHFHPLPQPMGFLFPVYLSLIQPKFSYLCRILPIFSLSLNNIKLKCALGRTIIQLAVSINVNRSRQSAAMFDCHPILSRARFWSCPYYTPKNKTLNYEHCSSSYYPCFFISYLEVTICDFKPTKRILNASCISLAIIS